MPDFSQLGGNSWITSSNMQQAVNNSFCLGKVFPIPLGERFQTRAQAYSVLYIQQVSGDQNRFISRVEMIPATVYKYRLSFQITGSDESDCGTIDYAQTRITILDINGNATSSHPDFVFSVYVPPGGTSSPPINVTVVSGQAFYQFTDYTWVQNSCGTTFTNPYTINSAPISSI